MATIYSSDLKLSIMATGENAGTWGSITNTNLYLLQQAIGGYQEVSIAGGAQTTALVMSDGALSNARNAVIKLTGAITGNQVVTIPNSIEKTYIVSNGTTGAFTVEFKTASGTGVTFGTTDKSTRIFFADGTNIVDTGTVSTSGTQTLTNKTLTSPSINQINDANGNEEIIFTSTASAVNELTIANAATGNAPSIATTGGDTNISLTIAPKGTGDVNVDADTLRVGDSNADATITTNGTGDLTLSTNSGTNSGTIKIFDAANGNIEVTPNGTGVVKLDGLSYPTADGSANQALVTNGSGVLSFATPASGSNVFLASTGAGSAVSSADLNGYFTSDYDVYEIFIVNCIASSDQTLKLRFATTGSYTVQTGNDYNTSQNYNYDNSTGISANGYSSTSAYQLVHIGSSTNFSTTSKIILFKPTSTSQKKNIHSFTLGNYSGTRYFTNAAGYWNSTTAVTGVRILPDSGTITYDNIYLYGIKNS